MNRFQTITVGHLRRMLEGEDEDTLVIFAADYGDYHHTTQALPLNGETEEVTIAKSAYSHSGFQVADEAEAEEDHEGECAECGGTDDEHEDDCGRKQKYLLIK